MRNEDKLIVALCDSFINDKVFELPNDVDYNELFKKAKAHNLIGVCHPVLQKAKNKELIPRDCSNDFLNAFFDLIMIYERQGNCYNELKALLASSQTPYIAFKGIRLRELYPIKESRSMGDIDILIKQEDRDSVKKLLKSNGFSCVKENGPVYNYSKDGVLVEVHTTLVNDFNEGVFTHPFDYASFDGYEGSFDDSFHLAYVIAHIAHHFKFYGAGIKLIVDLAVMQKALNIDVDRTMEYLAEIGLDKFARVILTVCYKWFGIGTDYGCDTEITENYLCYNGAFGKENTRTGSIVVRKELEKGNSSSSFMVKLRLAFPPYSTLKNIDYIKFIEGRPWLTPYAWCYRFAYNLKNKKDFAKNTVASIGDEKTNARAQRELEYFKEIGLV